MMRIGITYIILIIVLILAILLSVSFGSVNIDIRLVWQVVFSKFFEIGIDIDNNNIETIIWFHRFPRALLSCIVGMGLALIGVVLQATVKNPLADPQLLGVSSGASAGAVLSIITGSTSFIGINSTTFFAFIGGLLSFYSVLMIANYKGKLTPLRLVLAGVALSYFCSSVTSFLTLQSRDIGEIKSIQFWLLGGLSGAEWSQVAIASIVVFSVTIVFLVLSRYLNVMTLGDDTAKTLGVNITVIRRLNIILCAFVIAVIVSISGTIGFVGLVIPHTVRIIWGANHQTVLPISVLVGGIFLILCDLLSRIVLAPEELPIGIITALIGAPFFIWLMLRNQNNLS
ncbi:MAG: iron ABC transporter permease [Bacteroidota bacterium]